MVRLWERTYGIESERKGHFPDVDSAQIQSFGRRLPQYKLINSQFVGHHVEVRLGTASTITVPYRDVFV